MYRFDKEFRLINVLNFFGKNLSLIFLITKFQIENIT